MSPPKQNPSGCNCMVLNTFLKFDQTKKIKQVKFDFYLLVYSILAIEVVIRELCEHFILKQRNVFTSVEFYYRDHNDS